VITNLFRYTTPTGIPLRYLVPHWVAEAMEPITRPNMLRKQIPDMNWTRTRHGVPRRWRSPSACSTSMP
jgi:hypothetical protein